MRTMRTRRRAGLLLMTVSLALGVLAPFTALAAEPETDGMVEVKANEKEAFFNTDNSNYSSNAATKQFPPQAVCLVQPQACSFPKDGDPRDPTGASATVGQTGNTLISEGNKTSGQTQQTVSDNDNGTAPEEDPVPPDTLPVSIAFGQANYRSAVEFKLPTVAADQQVNAFWVLLQQGNPTYANSSPAIRQAVLAGLTCATTGGDGPGGRCKQEEFEKVATRNCDGEVNRDAPEPCPRDGTPLQVEMCPIVETSWKSGRAQDEDIIPESNCLYGAQGQIVEVAGTTFWAFDMSVAMTGWQKGLIPDAGLLLRPGAAENFAYGDPESTYSKQVTFLNTVSYTIETSKAPPPPAPFSPPPAAPTGQTDSFDVFASPQGGGTTTTTTTTGGVPFSGGSAPVTTTSPTTSVDQPAVSQPTSVPTTLAAGGFVPGQGETPWWVWMLVPVFLGGAYLMSQSLTEQSLAMATSSGGAMTRLLERRAATRKPDLIVR